MVVLLWLMNDLQLCLRLSTGILFFLKHSLLLFLELGFGSNGWLIVVVYRQSDFTTVWSFVSINRAIWFSMINIYIFPGLFIECLSFYHSSDEWTYGHSTPAWLPPLAERKLPLQWLPGQGFTGYNPPESACNPGYRALSSASMLMLYRNGACFISAFT